MITQLVDEYLTEQGYSLALDSLVFEELESIHFVGLLAFLDSKNISVNLADFSLNTESTLYQLVQWIESFREEQ